tara:strand:+ start:7 stop:201 length:195 start_codon:yes stop_codon:yes gene_type:complete
MEDKRPRVQSTVNENDQDDENTKMITFLENTIFNRKRGIIKSMDYKYKETRADLAKLRSAMEFM